MTLLFFGSDPWFSPPVLDALLAAGHKVPVVVTKGEAFGQGQGLRAKGQRTFKIIQAKTPQNISLVHLRSSFSLHPSSFSLSRPHAVVLAAFGPPFLPDDLLDWPVYGCLNVHASLLPRWRGASPVYASIAAGDRETGVTIMKMTREIDRGPILGQASTEIYQPSFKRSDPASSQGRTFSDFDSRESLTRRLGLLGGELIVDVLGRIDHIHPVRQPRHSPTPYSYRLKKEDGRIDWSKSAEEIERFIRAVSPWPGAWTEVQAQRKAKSEKRKVLKILRAHLEWLHASRLRPELRSSTPRLRLEEPNGFPLHALLVPDEVQLPGKNPITWKQFLAGHPGAQLN